MSGSPALIRLSELHRRLRESPSDLERAGWPLRRVPFNGGSEFKGELVPSSRRCRARQGDLEDSSVHAIYLAEAESLARAQGDRASKLRFRSTSGYGALCRSPTGNPAAGLGEGDRQREARQGQQELTPQGARRRGRSGLRTGRRRTRFLHRRYLTEAWGLGRSVRSATSDAHPDLHWPRAPPTPMIKIEHTCTWRCCGWMEM